MSPWPDASAPGLTRRTVLLTSGAMAAASLVPSRGHADAAALAEAIKEVTKGATVTPGRITLDLPALVENGNVVPLAISVDSPMTGADHVEAIHVFNEKNPQPHVITVLLGPRAGKAEVSTRIKLADTQRVTAIVGLSDGSFWSASADVIVTIAACTEEPP